MAFDITSFKCVRKRSINESREACVNIYLWQMELMFFSTISFSFEFNDIQNKIEMFKS